MVIRRSLALLLLAVTGYLFWLRSPVVQGGLDAPVHFVPQALPEPAEQARYIGPFTLEAAWHLTTANTYFGGYSGLVARGQGRFMAISDKGHATWFEVPPSGRDGPVPIHKLYREDLTDLRRDYDAEGVTRDPVSGHVWVSWETTNAISRFSPGMAREGTVVPPEIAHWGLNDGPESLVRLADGRFVTIREAFDDGWFSGSRHEALLFAGDPLEAGPPQAFTFEGPQGFSPVDAAQLPDGRVLVLLRKLVWPMPFRFAGRIAIADPAEIRPGKVWRAREVARLDNRLGVDNFEGMAIEPGDDGKVIVWLISDDNGAALQRTLLWKLTVDPAQL